MQTISKKLRKTALYLSYKCKDGNLQSVFSCLEIIWVLYDKIMNWSRKKANDENRDYFIISKGQATLALYSVLIEKGFFDFKDVANNIGKFDSRYCIQTDLTKFEGGIENNAGSLGHGLPFGAGTAYAKKIKNLKSNIFVLCGDGEFMEGTMWEACLFASSNKLDNLFVIIDDNNSAGSMVNMFDMKQKLEAFNFDVRKVDGHNELELEKVFYELKLLKNGKPKAVIAKTIRGFGSETMMKNDIWFHKSPDKFELEQLTREVEAL